MVASGLKDGSYCEGISPAVLDACPGLLALASYLPLCGDAFAEGDGITPRSTVGNGGHGNRTPWPTHAPSARREEGAEAQGEGTVMKNLPQNRRSLHWISQK